MGLGIENSKALKQDQKMQSKRKNRKQGLIRATIKQSEKTKYNELYSKSVRNENK